MNINAIDPIYPLRGDGIYPVRRDGIYPFPIGAPGYPYPSDALRSLALNRAERLARPSPAQSPGLETGHQHAPAIRKAKQVQELDVANAPAAGQSIDWLRDQFAAHRLTSAVQAFQNEQAADKDNAGAAPVNLGTPEHSLPMPKYLVAFGNPPIEQVLPPFAAQAGAAGVGPVAAVTATHSTTEDALATDPETRARVRRVRETNA